MPSPTTKSLMRSLGEFVGHIARGVRTDPRKKVIRRDVEEEQRGDITLRRTTIEEIEFKRDDPESSYDARRGQEAKPQAAPGPHRPTDL